MENLIFSLNVTLPIFLTIVIGYVLKQIHMLNDSFVTVANKFNFKVTLPALLFLDLYQADVLLFCHTDLLHRYYDRCFPFPEG